MSLNPEDEKVVTEFRRRLSERINIVELRIFGSRARGEATPESDLDLFVTVETLTPQLRRWIDEIAWEVGFEMDRIISPIVVTPDQIEHGPIGASPLILNIQREGIAVESYLRSHAYLTESDVDIDPPTPDPAFPRQPRMSLRAAGEAISTHPGDGFALRSLAVT